MGLNTGGGKWTNSEVVVTVGPKPRVTAVKRRGCEALPGELMVTLALYSKGTLSSFLPSESQGSNPGVVCRVGPFL